MERSQKESEKGYLNKMFLKTAIPIILVIVLFIIKKVWGDFILSFTQENKWFMLIGFCGVILYISWAFKDFYKKISKILGKLGISFLLLELYCCLMRQALI